MAGKSGDRWEGGFGVARRHGGGMSWGIYGAAAEQRHKQVVGNERF